MAKPATKDKKLDKNEIQAFERGMTISKMKTLLNKAAGVKEPDDEVDPEDAGDEAGPVTIHAGVALCKPAEVQGTKFKKRAVMFLHKNKNGQQLLPLMQDTPGFDRATFAHGTASIDSENKTIVILKLNKENKGIAALLKNAIKGTGRKFVRLCDETGKVLEEDLTDEDGLNAPASPTGDVAEAGATETVENYWDPAEEKARLMGLAMKIAKVGAKAPDQIGRLKELAQQAQAALATGVEQTAVAAVDALAEALGKLEEAPPSQTAPQPNAEPVGPVTQGAPPAPPPLPPSSAQKSGQAWTMTRARVGEEIAKLGKAIADHYKDQSFVGQLETLFQQKTAPILTTLDQSLATKLEELGTVPDGDKPKLMEDARKILDQYEQFVNTDPVLAQLDANPFTPLQTKKTLEATVNLLRKRLA